MNPKNNHLGSHLGGALSVSGTSAPIHSLQARLTRLFKQTITYVMLVSLQLGSLTQTKEAYAQYVLPGGQPNTGYVAPSISAPVSATNSAPFSGYNPDGTLYMGGQRIGNPHQVLHDAQIPAFMTITANRYTYSADPTHGQGTLAQMELATTNGSTSSVLLNRLYLSPNNPYATTQPLGQVWPYPNYQTYQGVLQNAQQAGYGLTLAQDGKTYAFKTLTAASAQAFTILINELPNTPQFRAAADPAGGGVGVRVEQNGDAAALANYYKTVQPYNYNWQPNYGSFTGSGNWSGQNGQLDPMYRGWVNSPGGAYSGFDGNLDGANGQQTNQQRFDAFLQQQQNEALANDKRVRSQTSANSLDLSSINPNTLYGQGYNLFDYGNASNPNLALENEYLRKLQNGEFEVGSAGYLEARRIAEERYRIAYATRLETGKPLQYSVSAAQNKANELKLADTNPNLFFGDGYDLFNYDPLTNPNGAAENALLTRLQSGQLTPGSPEYEQASQIAQQRYRNAYANSLAFNIAPKFTVAEAQRKANELDLSEVNPNELFGQGFDLFQYNPALRPNGEAENVLLAKLQNGELSAGSPEYLEATQIAQERLRVAYSQSLVPPEPKKKTWWKEIVILVVAAIAVYFTAGAASAWLAELAASSAATSASAAAAAAGAGAAGQAAAAGVAYAATLTAAASSTTLLGAAIAGGSAMAGSYAGAVIGTGLSTGSLSQGLRAGEKALTSGSIKTLATVIVLGGLGLTGLDEVLGSTGTSIVSNSIGSGAANSYMSGGSFGDALVDASLQNIVNVASAGAAREIGTQFPNLDGTNLANYAAHAGLGCLSASATGGNCAAGAAGAAAGEVVAATGLLNYAATGFGQTLTDGGTVFFGGLVGGTVASAVGSNDNINANFATGQATAQNAITHNYLNHRQINDRETELKDCAAKLNPTACRLDVSAKYTQISNEQDQAVTNCKTAEECNKAVALAKVDKAELMAERTRLQAAGLSTKNIDIQLGFVNNLIDNNSVNVRPSNADKGLSALNSVVRGMVGMADLAVNLVAEPSKTFDAMVEGISNLPTSLSNKYSQIKELNAAGYYQQALRLEDELMLDYAGLIQGGRVVVTGGKFVAKTDAGTTRPSVGSAGNGVYSSSRPVGDVFPELNGINQHFVADAAAGVNVNCVSCANAAHLRLTGQNPNAVASPSTGYGNQNSLLPSAPFGFDKPTSPASVIVEMQHAGNGATRPLTLVANGKDFHAINVVNRNGQIYFIDTQIGQIVTLQPNQVVRLGRPPL